MTSQQSSQDEHASDSRPKARTPEDMHSEAAQEQTARPASLEQQLKAVIAERDDYFDKWTRTRAELENFRKRIHKEMEQNRRYQALPLLRDLVTGLDNLSRAVEAAEKSNNIDELREGVKLVSKQLQDALALHSAVPIDAVGKPFDPNKHEAVQQIPTDACPPMTVVGEVQRGWMLHDRVVRPSSVLVSVAPDAASSPPDKPPE